MNQADTRPDYFRGDWLTADHPDYAAARRRIYNLLRDPHPPVIARCRGVADVRSALAYAREHGHRVVVRGTGWSLVGASASDALTIDLGLMRGIRINRSERTAWIQGGVDGGDLQIEAQSAGLAAATGTLPTTGAGLILGGGFGYLSRRHGSVSGSVLAVELVTAAGDVLLCSEDENEEVFWAIRGGIGAGLGVVTALKVRLYDLPENVLLGNLVWNGDNAPNAMRAFQGSLEWSSEDLGIIGMSTTEKVTLWVAHSGRPETARAEVDRLKSSFGQPDEDTVASRPFRDSAFLHVPEFPPRRSLWPETVHFTEYRDDTIAATLEPLADPIPGGAGAHRVMEFSTTYGGLSRAADYAGAPPRDVAGTIRVSAGAFWEDPADDADHEEWISRSLAGLRATQRDEDRAAADDVAASAAETLPRLVEVKRMLDPDDRLEGFL